MKKYKYDCDEISRMAQGRWIEIFKELAGHSSEVQQAIDNLGTTRHTWCPIHKGENGDAYRLFPDFDETGMSICNTCGTFSPYRLLMELNGWSFPETLEAIAKCLGIEGTKKPKNSKPNPEYIEKKKKANEEKDKRLLFNLRKVWKESLPLSAPQAEPARLYFARRGLSFETFLSCSSLRYHPSLTYFNEEKEKIGKYPALLALMQNPEGQGITIHRTYLTKEGKKAPVPKVKKIMPYPSTKCLSGTGVYLGFNPVDKEIENVGIAEGIETALAVREATGLPMIAACSAVFLEKLNLPRSVKFITVWGDNDESGRGQQAVETFCRRMKAEGLFSVIGLIPPKPEIIKKKSWDWNDVLVFLGPHYFKVQSQNDFKFE